jgi:protoporphyrinogen oxidase
LLANKGLNRWIDHKGQWSNQPQLGIKLILSHLFRGWKKIPQTSVLIDKFFSPLLGATFSQQYLSAACRGIYARNSHELTLDALFNPEFLDSLGNSSLNYYQFSFRYLKYKKHHKSFGSISFKNGLQDLIHALTIELTDHLELNIHPEKKFLQNAIICIPPTQIAKFLSETDQKLADLFMQIPMTSVQSMSVFTNKEFLKLKNSFGVLLTPQSSENILGVLAQSEIFQGRVLQSNTYYYTIIGQITNHEIMLSSFASMLISNEKI